MSLPSIGPVTATPPKAFAFHCCSSSHRDAVSATAIPITPDHPHCSLDDEQEARNATTERCAANLPSERAANAEDALRKYAEFVRLLTARLLRQTDGNSGVGELPAKKKNSSGDGILQAQCAVVVEPTAAAVSMSMRGCSPDLLALQNVVLQLQHALTLSQQEAATALDDAAAAVRAADRWSKSCDAAVTRVGALEAENAALIARNERLSAERRVLKSAYKDLVAQQFAVQTQQVECYVKSALATHEQYLLKNNSSNSNRSRTTTETTAPIDFEDVGSSSCCQAELTSTPGTVLAEEETAGQITPVKELHLRNVGFGASGALGFGKTFKLKEKKKEEPKPVGPYAPVRFELLPSSRSYDDEHDDYSMGHKVKNYFFQSPDYAITKRHSPLISVESLQETTMPPQMMPKDVTFGQDDSVDSCLPSPLLHYPDDSPSGRSWNVELHACDPAILRSLSIPIVHETVVAAQQQQPQSSSSRKMVELRARTYN